MSIFKVHQIGFKIFLSKIFSNLKPEVSTMEQVRQSQETFSRIYLKSRDRNLKAQRLRENSPGLFSSFILFPHPQDQATLQRGLWNAKEE